MCDEGGGKPTVCQSIRGVLEPAPASTPTLAEGRRRPWGFRAQWPRVVRPRVPQSCGPYLAPGRLEVPMSRGTPTKAASSPWGEACSGSRIMEQTPTGRATTSELGGWFRGASEARRRGLRPRWRSPAAGRAPPRAPRLRAQRDASRRSMSPAGPRSGPNGRPTVLKGPAAWGSRAGEGPRSPRPLSGLRPPAPWVNRTGPGGRPRHSAATALSLGSAPRKSKPLAPASPFQSNIF